MFGTLLFERLSVTYFYPRCAWFAYLFNPAKTAAKVQWMFCYII